MTVDETASTSQGDAPEDASTDTTPEVRASVRRAGRLLQFFYLILLVELSARAWLVISREMPPLRSAHRLAEIYYPVLAQDATDPDALQVLILGGSVVSEELEVLPDALADAFDSHGIHGEITVAATPAHTTRDSYNKMILLQDRHWDVIYIYHSINDIRLNLVPPDLYHEDYLHNNWYIETNTAADSPLTRLGFVAPFTIRCLVGQSANLYHGIDKAFITNKRTDWLDHGADLKSTESVRKNTQAIIDMVNANGAVLISGDFVLDTNQLGEREIWGKREHIIAGVETHNSIIHDLVHDQAENAIWIPFRTAFAGHEADYMTDCCHLTHAGAQVMAELIVTEILQTDSLREQLADDK